MKLQIRIQTDIKGVVLMKWVEFLARNIKDARSWYRLKQQSDHLLLCSSLSIRLRLLVVWRQECFLIQEKEQKQPPTSRVLQSSSLDLGKLQEVLVLRLTLENHDQNASLSDKYHRQPAGQGQSTFWPSTATLTFTQPHGITIDYQSQLILTISINLFQYLTPRTPLPWRPLDRYYLPSR